MNLDPIQTLCPNEIHRPLLPISWLHPPHIVFPQTDSQHHHTTTHRSCTPQQIPLSLRQNPIAHLPCLPSIEQNHPALHTKLPSLPYPQTNIMLWNRLLSHSFIINTNTLSSILSSLPYLTYHIPTSNYLTLLNGLCTIYPQHASSGKATYALPPLKQPLNNLLN